MFDARAYLRRVALQRFPKAVWKRRIRTWRISTQEIEENFLDILCDPARSSLDVGAASGQYTARLIPVSREVHAFEPYEPQFAVLVRKFAATRGVFAHNVALSNRTGLVELHVPAGEKCLATIETQNPAWNAPKIHQAQVATAELDSLGVRDVGFIKIDVEGHECAVLEGARATLLRDRPKLLVECEERHHPGAIDQVHDLLADLGYGLWFIHEYAVHPLSDFDVHELQNPVNVARGVRTGTYVNNFICLHSSDRRSLRALERRARVVSQSPYLRAAV